MLQLPQQFIQSISCCEGFDETEFVKAHQINSPTSIRLNPFKPTPLNFNLNNSVPWTEHGFYLEERPNFTHDVLFQAGCYYVQEAGSLFIEHALKSAVNFENNLTALDVCAAPGGKSTLLNSLLNEESLLVANEIIKPRAEILAQNLSKWGAKNVIVTNNDPVVFSEMESVFDIILVDAPCSGSGLFRKQPDAINEWSIDNVNLCSQRQKRILSTIINSLKADGVLVYSTCSYSEQENEEIINWLVSEFHLESLQIPIEENWGIVETSNKGFGYRFYPDKTKSEGFFCSVLKKSGVDSTYSSNKKIKRKLFEPIKQKDKILFTNWIDNPDTHEIIKFKEDYLLTNIAAIDFINRYSHLYLKKVGTNIGSIVNNTVLPHHDLALSIHKSNEIPFIDCSYEEAIGFLKKELQIITGDKGWNLMRFNQLGLGWIKHLGNRINNYLPNEFRIIN